tara:strand:+ start:504 stop:743 length:240 start_codon:yes stop_codon:yes gene_type:complete
VVAVAVVPLSALQAAVEDLVVAVTAITLVMAPPELQTLVVAVVVAVLSSQTSSLEVLEDPESLFSAMQTLTRSQILVVA